MKKTLSGKMCGTCHHWGRKHATSARTGAIIPNALCSCNADVEIPVGLPFSVQKVSTLCKDGSECPTWQQAEGVVEINIMQSQIGVDSDSYA